MGGDAERVDSAPDVGVLLVRAGWLDVMDNLHGGFCHSLNGRLSSLDGLVQIIRMDGPSETPVEEFLEGECTRLEGTVRAMRALLGDPAAPPEPLMVGDLVREAEAVYAYHRERSKVSTESSEGSALPPFRANRARWLRLLLIILGRVGRGAGDRVVHLGASAQGGRVGVHAVQGDGSTPGHPEMPDTELEALSALAGLDGGTVERVGGGLVAWAPAMGRPGGSLP